ncbi:zinc finger and BTB domain-containing protein 41-like isoform X2 [Episyrphus balteatus]|nr:zinc finger and BTB domain-containing protein 41-like isoform X2 [Episyrphus balteatus]
MPVEDIIAAGEKAIRETKISCILCKTNFETHDDFVTHYPNHQFNLHCTICQKDLKKVKLLERHMRMHLREKAYTCPICPRSFYARDDMRVHIQNHIKKEWVYRCNVCQKDYFKNREFEKHMIKHLEVTEDGNKTRESIRNDDEMENDEDINLIGSDCDSNYSDEEDEIMMKIELDSPKAQETFQLVKEEIPSDDECISNINGEKEHNSIKMEMDIPPSSDTVKSEVDKESTYPMESNNSIDLDEKEDATVKSEICEPELIIKLENPETDLSDEEEIIDEPDGADGADGPDEQGEHDDASTTFSVSKYEITDDEREKYYQNLLDLVKVKCHVPDCQTECSSFQNTMLHFTNDHLAHKEPPFVCVVCSQEFSNKKLIKQHSRKYYSFKCPVCFKLNKSFSNLNRHVRSSHLNDRYKCLFCDKRFGLAGKLRVHLNSHSSKKLFACYICHKEFYSSNGLYLHSKSHMVIKELQCGNCGRQIPSKSRLMKHIANCVQRRKGGLN